MPPGEKREGGRREAHTSSLYAAHLPPPLFLALERRRANFPPLPLLARLLRPSSATGAVRPSRIRVPTRPPFPGLCETRNGRREGGKWSPLLEHSRLLYAAGLGASPPPNTKKVAPNVYRPRPHSIAFSAPPGRFSNGLSIAVCKKNGRNIKLF